MSEDRAMAIAAAGVFLLSMGCGLRERVRGFFEDQEREAVAVRIGNHEFSRADIDRFFDTRLSEFRDPAEADQVKSNLLEAFIEDRLLLLEAERHGVEPDPQALNSLLESIAAGSAIQPGTADPKQDRELVKDLKDSLKSQQYLGRHLFAQISISDEECEEFYQEHAAEFVAKDTVRLREILIDDEALAVRILSQLKGSRNKNFAELARTYSKASTAADGGELGAFQRGELPEEFEKAVFSIAPGSASRIVRSRYGFHLFLVEERIRAHPQKLWEVKEQIRDRIRTERERSLIQEEITRLASQMPIQIEHENLGFNYVGTRFHSR